jgi:hypothetical protein
MKSRPSPKQLASMRNAFAPLKMTSIPLEGEPIHVVGVPPTKKPATPNELVPMIARKAA